MLYLSIIAYILLVIVLIITRINNKEIISLLSKTGLSIILIIFIVEISYLGNRMNMWISLSVIFSSTADIFLGIQKIEKKAKYLFYIALVLVAGSQIMLFTYSVVLTTFNIYSIPIAILINSMLYYFFSKKCKMEKMQKYAMVYGFVFLLLIMNIIFNISIFKSNDLIYVMAIILYWISDIILFIQKFIAEKNKNILDGMNKLISYTAQILFVLYMIKRK